MEQSEKNKITVELQETIQALQETIKQQEKLLVQMLASIDESNGIEHDLSEDILDN